jgi:hypothetical protein
MILDMFEAAMRVSDLNQNLHQKPVRRRKSSGTIDVYFSGTVDSYANLIAGIYRAGVKAK